LKQLSTALACGLVLTGAFLAGRYSARLNKAGAPPIDSSLETGVAANHMTAPLAFDFATPIELDFARPNDYASAGDKPVFTFFMGVTR